MKKIKYSIPFDVNKYKEINDDLKNYSDEDAIKHYKQFGIIEKRKYYIIKTAILFHVGNIDVFFKIYKNNISLFNRQVLIFITLHDINHITVIREYIPYALFTLIENKGADIGGFLHNMKLLINHPNYKDIETIYFIHTKTNDNWRRKLLFPITSNYKKIEEELHKNKNLPIIVGSEEYCFRNKGNNRIYINDIINRNKEMNNLFVNDWQSYLDEYIFENNNLKDNQNIYKGFNIIPEFYKNYENDLCNYSNEEAINHYNNIGANEYYRINNPCYVKQFGKDSFFIAGTIFACNKEYFKVFENIDFNYEYSVLENGYVLNNIPRKIHAWEYLFGLLAYARNGYIISINNNGIMNYMKDKDVEFNINIYKNCNTDLKHYDNNTLLLYYNDIGKNDNRISTKKQLYKRQAIINNNSLNATIAILMNIPPEIYSDEYKKLLINVNEIVIHNGYIDIYLGDGKNNNNMYNGLSIIYFDIHEIVDNINSYNILQNKENINFYLGFNLHCKYDNTIML